MQQVDESLRVKKIFFSQIILLFKDILGEYIYSYFKCLIFNFNIL